MMRSADVLAVLASLRAAGLAVWVDGGWGVDALLGEETRDHDDLDVVIPLAAVLTATAALRRLGYAMIEDELPTRFVVRASGDRRVDFHPVTITPDGDAIQTLQDGTPALYPAPGFGGEGSIGRQPVPCLTAEVQLHHHLGYDPDSVDFHDMTLLAERFGLVLPPPYVR
jgi:lincosamide nucleotidyltransferase A/C/D/E